MVIGLTDRHQYQYQYYPIHWHIVSINSHWSCEQKWILKIEYIFTNWLSNVDCFNIPWGLFWRGEMIVEKKAKPVIIKNSQKNVHLSLDYLFSRFRLYAAHFGCMQNLIFIFTREKYKYYIIITSSLSLHGKIQSTMFYSRYKLPTFNKK